VRRREILALLAATLATGCGYSLQGRGITLDPSVKRIGVPLFRDESGQPGLDTVVTAAVIEELLKRGRFTVVQDTAGVDAVVDGQITAYLTAPIGYTDTTGGGPSTALASRYTARIVAKVVFRKVGVTEPLWENDSLEQRDEFDLGTTPQTYLDREQDSMQRLADEFARSLVSAMLEAF
jgi:hypothetical protein